MALYSKSIRNDSGCDTYETPVESMDMILEHLDPGKDFIWEPFAGTGHSTRHMRSRGFEVVNGFPCDFFEQPLPTAPPGKSLIMVSNPPYSTKQKVFARCKEIGLRRYALLLPAATLYTVYFYAFNKWMEDAGIRLSMVIHTSRCCFLDPASGQPVQRDNRAGSASFDVAWMNYGVNLPRDIVFIKREPKKLGRPPKKRAEITPSLTLPSSLASDQIPP